MASGRTNQFFYSSFSYAYEEIIDREFLPLFSTGYSTVRIAAAKPFPFREKKKQLVRRRSIMNS